MKILLTLLVFLSSNLTFAADATNITGTIALGKGLAAPANATVFIAARPIKGGPPIAVLKIANPTFPLDFKMGQENSMMGGQFAGEVELTVRATQVSDPISRTPGDLFGTLKTKVGASKVSVTLDHKI